MRIFFDCETFNHYADDAGPKELPVIIPYLIGACTDEPGSYRHWFGGHSTEEFLSWLFTAAHGKTAVLYAFNVDYDFQAIKPFILNSYPNAKISYHLTSQKKFIFGSIRLPGVNIQIKDLYNWDRTYSLSKYYKYIWELAESDKEYADIIEKYGIEKLEKLKLVDYCKKNFRPEGDHYVYEDENDVTKTFDMDHELTYLKNDVVGLPIVLWHIQKFRQTCIELLKFDGKLRDRKMAHAISIPSFSKRLLGHHLNKDEEEPGDAAALVDGIFRSSTSLTDYYAQDMSYFGGFVANNKHITKLFNSFDKDGNPNIVSIDVNSMYPWVMSEGVPSGLPTSIKPEGTEGVDYIKWHSIIFTKPISSTELYRYKPKYDVFNNKFFGDSYFHYLESAGPHTRRAYILDSVLQLFLRACDAHIEIEETFYQTLDHSLKPYVEFLYVKKENPKSKQEKNAIKLILNSLYGKLAERYHEDYYLWNNESFEFRNVCDLREDRNSILAGLFITSKSRVRLIGTILDEIDNGNVFLGCDTDSIKLIVNNPLKLPLDSKKLGYWGLEGWYTDFVHNNKKKKYYMHDSTGKYEDKLAVSGIPKDVVTSLSHEDKVLLFSEENDVEFPKIKNASTRNPLWQICIKKVNVRFNQMKGRDPTHIYRDGRIWKI